MHPGDKETSAVLTHMVDLATTVRMPSARALLLSRIARFCAKHHRVDAAERIVTEIMAISEKVKEPFKAVVKIEIGYCFGMMGLKDRSEEVFCQVLAAVKERSSVVENSGILFRLAEVYCDLKLHERALTMVETIADTVSDAITVDMYRDTVLTAVSRKYLESGDGVSAIETLKRVGCQSTKALEVVGIFLNLLEKGDTSEQEGALMRDYFVKGTD